MPKTQTLYTVLFLFYFFTQSLAQISKGNKFFKQGEYFAAIPYYQKEVKKKDSEAKQEAYLKLGFCYKTLNDYVNAEKDYSEAFKISEDASPDNYYNYAQVLKVNSKYEEAAKYLNKYIAVSPKDENAKRALRFCNEINYYMTQPVEYEIKNIESINTELAEFSPFVVENKLMFVAERESFDFVSYEVSSSDGQPFIQMYVSQLEGLDVKKSKTLSKKINAEFHDGPASMSADGKTLYFTRVSNKQKKGFTNFSKIYTATGGGREWKNITPLEINSDEFSVAHPCISPDGQTLFFTSNMPGGFGGKDIWMIKKTQETKYKMLKKVNGEDSIDVKELVDAGWSKPINLGIDINTEGDEMFPSIRKDGILYFSSNGLPGYGGLDVYSAKQVESKWILQRNEGLQLNSNADDFGPTFLNDSIGYFSSNRLGGKGKDDIYLFKFHKKYVTVGGTVLLTQNPKDVAKDHKIVLFDEKDKAIDSTRTNQKGFFEFRNLRSDKKYMAVMDETDTNMVHKARYYLAEKDSIIKRASYKLINGKFAFKNLPIYPNSLPMMGTDEDLVFAGILKTADGEKKPLKNVKVKIVSKYGDVMEETRTDDKGNFSFKNIPADQDYIVSIDDGDLNLPEGTKVALSIKNGKDVKTFYKAKEGFAFKVLSSEKDLIHEEDEELVNFSGSLKLGENSNEPLKNAKVKILNKKGEVIGEAVTDENGNFTFKNIPGDQDFIVALDENDVNLIEGTKVSIMSKGGKNVKSFVKGKDAFSFKLLSSEKDVMKEMDVDEDVSFAGTLLTGDKDGKALKNVKVKIKNKKGEVIGETTTNEYGAFAFRNIPGDQDFVVEIDEGDVNLPEGQKITMTNRAGRSIKSFTKEKDSFSFKVLTSDKTLLNDMDAYDADLTMGLYGYLYNQDHKPIPNAKIKVKDEKGRHEQKLVTSQIGKFQFDNLQASKNYVIELEEGDPALANVTKVFLADAKGKIYRTIEIASGQFSFKILEADKNAIGEFAVEDPWMKLAVQKKKEKEDLKKKGAVDSSLIKKPEPEPDFNELIVENIHYGYGKFDLTPDAQATMDKAFKMLTDYPKTVLEISSHTDAQSSSGFNWNLSWKRANTAVAYLVSKGISPNRLKARCYGETKILNQCTEGVKCSDEDYRVNRRTEFRLTKAKTK